MFYDLNIPYALGRETLLDVVGMLNKCSWLVILKLHFSEWFSWLPRIRSERCRGPKTRPHQACL